MKKQVNVVQKVGSWAFIVGIIIAIIAGFWQLGTVMTSILIILGLIVGFLNVTGKETNSFLFSALVLVVMSGVAGPLLSDIQYIGLMLQEIFRAMMLFIIPASLIVALKAVYALAEAE